MRKPRTEQEKRRDEWQDAEAVWLLALAKAAESPDPAADNAESQARAALCKAEGAYYVAKLDAKRAAVLARAEAKRRAEEEARRTEEALRAAAEAEVDAVAGEVP